MNREAELMNVFGLHTFAIAPVWDLDLIEPQMERLKGLGIGLLEIPLLRPEEIDTKRTRAFADAARRRADPVARPAGFARCGGAAGRGAGFSRTGLRRLRGGGQRSAWRRHLRHDRQDYGPRADGGRNRRHVPLPRARRQGGQSAWAEARHRTLQPLRNASDQSRHRRGQNHRARRRRQHLHPSRHLSHAYRGGEL